MNRKAFGILGVMFLAAALLSLPAPAKAEMYVEGYIGGTWAADLDGFTFHQSDAPPPPDNNTPGSFLQLATGGSVQPAVIGGVKVGTWFVPGGFLGYNYPDWMKYFGFYTDFSYHRLDIRNHSVQVTDYTDAGVFNGTFPGSFQSEGMAATWAFMFAGRYGFLPDADVPFGRLQPYVAVGPAILFTSMQPKALVLNGAAAASPGSASDTVIALALDAGVRYMALKNVSIDISFKYRYAQPKFGFDFIDVLGHPSSFNISPTYNLFSGQVGVAYHF